jgi:hypothetical protein
MLAPQEIRQQIRHSLGLPLKQEPVPTVPQEGHICDFPIWSSSKRRSTVTTLRIDYRLKTRYPIAQKTCPTPVLERQV